ARDARFVSHHGETVILGGDEHALRAELMHGMIPAAMPGRELGRLAAVRDPDQLMSQADTERGESLTGQLADGIKGVADRSGITGAVAEEQAVRRERTHVG